MPKVLLQFQGSVIKEVALTKDETTIGRSPRNDIVIDNPGVSGLHCKIIRKDDSTYTIEDMGSLNGVFLNERKVTRVALKNNDVIVVFKHSLKFLDDHVPTPAVSVRSGVAEGTMLVTPERQKELAKAATRAAKTRPALVRVLTGATGPVEHRLNAGSTYIGKSDRAQIKIKGTGIFGLAPRNAAMIAKRHDGYFIVPVKVGYPKLNGKRVRERTLLNHGDVIVVGGTTMRFEHPSEASEQQHDENAPPGMGNE